jgi:hypothetical protein
MDPKHASEDPRRQLPFDLLAEKAIRDAYAEGQVDNLPGLGESLAGMEEPCDEDWWLKAKLKREQLSVLPPSLEILRDVEQTLARAAQFGHESAVRRELLALNERIRDANFRSVSGPPSTQMPIDIEGYVRKWRSDRGR